jgi:NAD(P)-dependent dehydrogenase (short-subunit alcohol dehydrogenase family)
MRDHNEYKIHATSSIAVQHSGPRTSNRFAGKVALVTGASSGIGRATALAFAREGASVAIASRGPERGIAVLDELETLGGDAEFVRADVSKARDVEALVTSVLARFGRLDVAVNNAGAIEIGVFKPLADFDETEFDGHIALNMKSVWLCMKHEIAQMLAQGGGAIVNTSSVTGLGGAPQSAFYAAAKAAVVALTKSAALEYAARNIRINALVPGAFATPMLNTVFEHVKPGDPAAAEAMYQRRIPVGRIGRPEEAADAVLWLCSDEATYVTGHSLIVDGGLTAAFR